MAADEQVRVQFGSETWTLTVGKSATDRTGQAGFDVDVRSVVKVRVYRGEDGVLVLDVIQLPSTGE